MKMKYCSFPTFFFFLTANMNRFVIFPSFISVICYGAGVHRDEGMRLKNRLFFCDFQWLIALRLLAVGIIIPTANSFAWFDSLHEMLLILTIPWSTLCLMCVQGGRVWSSVDWCLTAAAVDMHLVSWSSRVTVIYSLHEHCWWSDWSQTTHLVMASMDHTLMAAKTGAQKMNAYYQNISASVPHNSHCCGFERNSPPSNNPRSACLVMQENQSCAATPLCNSRYTYLHNVQIVVLHILYSK